jgi:hypothetical protein
MVALRRVTQSTPLISGNGILETLLSIAGSLSSTKRKLGKDLANKLARYWFRLHTRRENPVIL